MINETIVITRGEGPFEYEFDFANATPPKEISDDEKWLMRIEDSLLSQITKRSSEAGGSNDEIELDSTLHTVTVKLTQDERNRIPDSGYKYKLFFVNESNDWEEMAHGSITSSGDAPEAEIDPALAKISAVNGSTLRNVTQNFNFRITDDYVYANTTSNNITGTLPAASAFGDVKRYIFKNTGTGTLTVKDHQANDVVILNEQESCKVASNGSVWEVLFTGVGELPE